VKVAHETTEAMTRANRRGRRRWVLIAGACAALFVGSPQKRAAAGSVDDCRAFHRECTDATDAGYSDPGICHVEMLECPGDPEPVPPRASPKARIDGSDDSERSFGECRIGP
jgi:hypothetical protein